MTLSAHEIKWLIEKSKALYYKFLIDDLFLHQFTIWNYISSIRFLLLYLLDIDVLFLFTQSHFFFSNTLLVPLIIHQLQQSYYVILLPLSIFFIWYLKFLSIFHFFTEMESERKISTKKKWDENTYLPLKSHA